MKRKITIKYQALIREFVRENSHKGVIFEQIINMFRMKAPKG